MPEENGVTLALAAARSRSDGRSPYIVIRDVLATFKPITENSIYNFERKGFFPHERAKVIADAFDIPIERLVSPAVRAILANS